MKKEYLSLKEKLELVHNSTILHAYSCVRDSISEYDVKYQEEDLEQLAIKIFNMWLKDSSDTAISRLAYNLISLLIEYEIKELLNKSVRELLELVL